MTPWGTSALTLPILDVSDQYRIWKVCSVMVWRVNGRLKEEMFLVYAGDPTARHYQMLVKWLRKRMCKILHRLPCVDGSSNVKNENQTGSLEILSCK